MEFRNIIGPDFGRSCHRVIVIISDNHCSGEVVLSDIQLNYQAKYLAFWKVPDYSVSADTPGFGCMVFGYMVFFALFRLYGQWSIRF